MLENTTSLFKTSLGIMISSYVVTEIVPHIQFSNLLFKCKYIKIHNTFSWSYVYLFSLWWPPVLRQLRPSPSLSVLWCGTHRWTPAWGWSLCTGERWGSARPLWLCCYWWSWGGTWSGRLQKSWGQTVLLEGVMRSSMRNSIWAERCILGIWSICCLRWLS